MALLLRDNVARCDVCGGRAPRWHKELRERIYFMCCQCWVRDGKPPADWHSGCGFIKMWLESPPPVFVARFSSVHFAAMTAFIDRTPDGVILYVSQQQYHALTRLNTECAVPMQVDGSGFDEEAWLAGIARIIGTAMRDELLQAERSISGVSVQVR